MGKYYLARKKGLNKTESKTLAGYAPSTLPSTIENTIEYQKIQRFFKDELLEQISMREIATALKNNIVQDTDRGAKNQAIKIALDKLEPDQVKDDKDQQVVVVLR